MDHDSTFDPKRSWQNAALLLALLAIVTTLAVNRPTPQPLPRLLFSTNNYSQIRVIGIDGSDQEVLTLGLVAALDPSPSPEGSETVFMARDDDFVFDIYRADTQTGTWTRLTTSSSGKNDAQYPTWSPDGSQIAFSCEREICLMRPDGTHRIKLTQAGGFWPTWSPDGARIAYQRTTYNPLNPGIFVMQSDGSNVVKIAENPDVRYSGLSWSPDGTMVFFAGRQYQGVEDTPDIYVARSDGSGITRLTTAANSESNVDPVSSPNSNQIAFDHFAYDDSSIMIINADGTGLFRLVGPKACCPAWSPDGKWIAYVNVEDPSSIYIIRPDGTQNTLVASDGSGPIIWLP